MPNAYFRISDVMMNELLRLPEGVKFLGLRPSAYPYCLEAVISGDSLPQGEGDQWAEVQPIYESIYDESGKRVDYRLKEMRILESGRRGDGEIAR